MAVETSAPVPFVVPAHAATEMSASEAMPLPNVTGRLLRLYQWQVPDLAPPDKDIVLQPVVLPAIPETPPPEPAAEPLPPPNATDRFIHEHKLTSVLIDEDGGIAIVNGKVLRVGEKIDGYRLVRLAPGIAFFTGGDNPDAISLEIVTQPQRGARTPSPADDAAE